MLPPASAPLLYREIEKISCESDESPREQVLALAALLERIFFEATKQEQFAFSTLFARISYAGHKFNFQEDILRDIHRFRVASRRVRHGSPATRWMLVLGARALAGAVLVLTGTAIPAALLQLFGQPEEQDTDIASTNLSDTGLNWLRLARVVALDDKPGEQCLLAVDEAHTGSYIRVIYGLADRNENFMPTIRVIRQVFGFPVTLNLLDVDVDARGDYRPRAIVVEPDYLVDVTAVAECFKDTGADPYAYLAKKFLPFETTEAILLGNIANFFLDRLLNEPAAEWATVFRETFQLFPFTYAPMTDVQVKSVAGKAQRHFLTLKNMAASGGGFSKEGIDAEDCLLEPTFFSEQYGIQGRLDLFYHTDEKSAIVELKSGTPYRPNSYGIQRSHFTQTLLYDLLVRSVFGQASDPAKYILYSGVDLHPLRFAPTVVPEQWEALQLRNQLVAIERLLAGIRPGEEAVPLFGRLRPARGQGFSERDFARFEAAYTGLSTLEKKYFNAFTGFIAREHWLAKTGEEGSDTSHGHANLWRAGFSEKQEGFEIVSHLLILENRADQPDPVIVFSKTEKTNPLANFRVGDIAVLYPAADESETVLQHQVLKCTVTAIDRERVVVQLRYRQHNLKPFETEGHWCIEPDMMDTGFMAMYRGLLEWAEAPPAKRSLVLEGSSPGRRIGNNPESPGAQKTSEIWSRVSGSPGFFLLWGPPGTGKTSVMLRDLAAAVLEKTTDNLLLLAYTNRAVDEICEALDAIGGNIRTCYLRIGGKHATAGRFRDQLLSVKIAGARSRADLKSILDKHRIVVSTLASFGQNEGLLQIKKFQRLVVDEASQILEPQLIGLLTRFEHFTLIGDHRQLPAVTAQRPEFTTVTDADLGSVGLTDLRDSYFERLYRRCIDQGWNDAYGQLEHQGRMHAEIMTFPNHWFYGGMLQTLPPPLHETQHAALNYMLPGLDPVIENVVTRKRVVFLPAELEVSSGSPKTNRREAELVARLVLSFQKLWAVNGKAWHPAKTLGIITPWRAQIAQIRASLAGAGIDPDDITIDTVERYQGGARDIILVSTCVNTPFQLTSLVSLSNEGVDRKLNVALTRAREHLIMLGNAVLLAQDERYRAFIEQYGILLAAQGELKPLS